MCTVHRSVRISTGRVSVRRRSSRGLCSGSARRVCVRPVGEGGVVDARDDVLVVFVAAAPTRDERHRNAHLNLRRAHEHGAGARRAPDDRRKATARAEPRRLAHVLLGHQLREHVPSRVRRRDAARARTMRRVEGT